jgi:hypothetical protein
MVLRPSRATANKRREFMEAAGIEPASQLGNHTDLFSFFPAAFFKGRKKGEFIKSGGGGD